MMRVVRFLAAWLLLGIGHALSIVMNAADWLGWIYPAYNRVIIASSDVQGSGPGPWREPSGDLLAEDQP